MQPITHWNDAVISGESFGPHALELIRDDLYSSAHFTCPAISSPFPHLMHDVIVNVVRSRSEEVINWRIHGQAQLLQLISASPQVEPEPGEE